MVKTPKMRHSRSSREPLTIDLEAAASARPDAPETAHAPVADVTEDLREQPAAGHDEADEAMAARSEASPEPLPAEPDRSSGSTANGFNKASAPAEAASPVQRSARDGFSRILAGVIGAAIALAVSYGLFSFGVFGSTGASDSGGALQAQIDELKQQVSALQAAPQGDLAGQVTGLAGEVETLKAEIAAQESAAAPGADPAAAQGLTDRLTAVETALAGLAQASGGQAPADVTALVGKIDAIEAGAKGATDSAAATAAKITALEQTVAALSSKVESQASQPQVALAIASAALRSAIERGSPFTAELDTLATLSSDQASISALRPYAEQGVPTLAVLKAEADASAAAMIAAASPPDENAGFLSRLLHSAGSLVTVRPLDAVDGADAGSILARMEAAIEGGRLDAALAEFNSLPQPSQAAAASFGEKLKARQAADQLVAQAIAAATKA